MKAYDCRAVRANDRLWLLLKRNSANDFSWSPVKDDESPWVAMKVDESRLKPVKADEREWLPNARLCICFCNP